MIHIIDDIYLHNSMYTLPPACLLLIKPLEQIRTLNIQRRRVLIQTKRLMRPIGAMHVDIRGVDIPADRRRTACEGRDERLVILARPSLETAEDDVLYRQLAGELLAQCNVLLPIALGDFNCVIDVVD